MLDSQRGVVLAKSFLQLDVCIPAIIALSLALLQVGLSYAGTGNVGNTCASALDCQAQGGLYCDKDEHVCKESPRFHDTLENRPAFQARGCQKAADCSLGWECVGYLCIVNARGCRSNSDCLAHQICVPDHPESGPASQLGACQPEDVAKKLLNGQK